MEVYFIYGTKSDIIINGILNSVENFNTKDQYSTLTVIII